MNELRRVLTCVVCFLFPVKISFWFLNLLGHNVSRKSRIGFSLIMVEKLELWENSKIGNFNIVLGLKTVSVMKDGGIGYGNVLKGPISLYLKERGAIGNRNAISRAGANISYGSSSLTLGKLSKITSGHRIDCLRSIRFGDYSILAGNGSQMWTHGYFHEKSGPGRFRIDGEIKVGDNVYIGSQCVFNAGVVVGDGITVGSNSTISKSIMRSGLYVSQPLRYIDYDIENVKGGLHKVDADLLEEVYEKRI